MRAVSAAAEGVDVPFYSACYPMRCAESLSGARVDADLPQVRIGFIGRRFGLRKDDTQEGNTTRTRSHTLRSRAIALMTDRPAILLQIQTIAGRRCRR